MNCMVEPISLALISGAAGLGLALGKWQRNEELPHLQTTEDVQVKIKKEPVLPRLHFLKVEDIVDPNDIVSLVSTHNQVFINIRKLLIAPNKLYKFLNLLNEKIDNNDLIVHQISKDLLLVTTKAQEILVKTLTKMAETKPDELLPREIAGY